MAHKFNVMTGDIDIIPASSSGSTALQYHTATSNYTILSTDDVIFVDSSGGAFNLTLPNPATLQKVFRIVDITGFLNTNNVTLVRFGSEKIEGLAASKLLQTDWGYFEIATNNTDWFLD